MIPTKFLRELPKRSPDFMKELIKHRKCRVVVGNPANWAVKLKHYAKGLVTLNDGLDNFSASLYPLIANTLRFGNLVEREKERHVVIQVSSIYIVLE